MIEKLKFGMTGHLSTRTLFGAASLSSVTQARADRTMELLMEYGVNHLDVAASYGDGEAEKRLAPWLEDHREEFFLATKTGKRSYEGARADLEGSLERLRVDRVDLIQLHNLVDEEGWQQAFDDGGALQALVDARSEGLVSHIGVTGHGMHAPQMHLRSIEQFPFASVLVPYNYLLYQNHEYAQAVDTLFRSCKSQGIAVQTIKSIARRPWQGEKRRTTWYEPLEEQSDIDLAVSWVLNQPDVFINTVGDIDLLPLVLEAASRFGDTPEPPTRAEMEELLNRNSMESIFEPAEGAHA
jgi:aryl-alcohol dehydrogenase-like predicted oxidoreductase